MASRLKENLRRFLVVALLLLTASLGINLYIILSTQSRIYHQITPLPERNCGLVLGTDRLRFNGSTNLHFLNRIDSAARIFKAGKVNRLLISGNENNHGCNEVLEIENGILAAGVPATAIELDFGGNRTVKSARRACEIYHLSQIVIVTDAFHAPRAIFLCRHFGIDAVAICPDDEPFGFWSLRYSVREYFARLLAFFEVLIEPTNARHG